MKIVIEYKQKDEKAIFYINEKECLIEYGDVFGLNELPEILEAYIRNEL